MDADVSRRQLVIVAGVGAGGVALAGCSSGSSSSAGSSSSGSAGSSSSTGSASESSGSSGAGNDEPVLASLSAIPVGQAIAAKDPSGKPIIVAQPTAGKAVAFSAICTHMGCQVAPAGAELDCPCHGSRYNALTGAVLQGPAPRPLPGVPVHVADGNVIAGSA